MSTRLQIYNLALLMCGERSIASLSDAVESRRLLDTIWNADGVRKCLEEGQWRFARRSIQIDYDPDIDPGFGYARAFPHPDDYVVTAAVSLDEFFKEPFLDYRDEGHHWYADVDTLYVSYVSDDENYGLDLNAWPGYFEDFVAAHLAHRVAFKMSGSDDKRDKLLKERERLKTKALNKDMMGEPTRFPPTGSWVRARRQGGGRRDGGRRTGNLY